MDRPKLHECCSTHPPHLKEENKQFNFQLVQMIGAFVFSLPLVVHMGGISVSIVWQIVCASIVQFGAGFPFYVGAWRGLRRFSANMDTLVALGTSAAYGFSLYTVITHAAYPLYFETSALLIAFILLGRFLEAKAKRRAHLGMSALLQLQPKMARIKISRTEQEYREVPIEEVPLKAVFVVRPGERIPVDGWVLTGSSYVDEAMLTGESVPVLKQEGSSLFAGTVNREGLLEAKATRVGPETALGHMIRLVEQAQNSKAPIQRVADRVTAIFVPCILVSALLTFLGWWLIGANPSEGLINAVAVLVIACPCALGLATPMVIIVACGIGAKLGILIKDAAVLEMAGKIQAVLLDKTGTVTTGKLQVTSSAIEEHFLSIVAAMAQHSDHPASQALAQFFSSISPPLVSEYVAISGKGVSGTIQGQHYVLGSPAFLRERGIDTSDYVGAWERETGMIVALGDQKSVLGYFILADRVQPGAKDAIQRLHRLGVIVHLLSGDRRVIAEKVARELGIDQVSAEVLPEDKANEVARLKRLGKVAAMVGDGINDAPALAAADIGFAIGSGTDVALESASVILIRSDLHGVIDTIQLARRTFTKIRQNLIFAFGYNILGIPLAAFGFLSPLIAGIAMALSSISVVINALLLQGKKNEN